MDISGKSIIFKILGGSNVLQGGVQLFTGGGGGGGTYCVFLRNL